MRRNYPGFANATTTRPSCTSRVPVARVAIDTVAATPSCLRPIRIHSVMAGCEPSGGAQSSRLCRMPHSTDDTWQPSNSAMRHNPTYGIMCRLMSEDGVIALGIPKALKRRHLHVIAADAVIRHVAAVPDGCAGCGKEGFRALDPLHGLGARRGLARNSARASPRSARR